MEVQGSHQEVALAMQQAMAVVVPSIWYEGYPLVIAEAFAHGRPVVVTSGGSAASIIDDSVGWCAKPTATALAETLNSIGPSAAAEKGSAARNKYVRDNSPTSALRTLLKVYEEVLTES